ncbi:MAG: hypothetical protein QM493_08675 [Sulfurovum sp.]
MGFFDLDDWVEGLATTVVVIALPVLIPLAVAETIKEEFFDGSSSSNDGERESIRKVKEERNERIREEINKYKENQSLQIKDKYGAVIELNELENVGSFFSLGTHHYEIEKLKVKIISKDKNLENRISLLKQETNELREALKELKDIR